MDNKAKFIAFQTIVTKEVRRFMRIWVQTIVPPAITIMLYFIIFGNLIGSRIGEMGGFSYMEFVVPGLIMMGVMTNSYSNVVSSFFNARFQRHVDEMLVSPLPNYIILLGFVCGGVARGLAVGLVVTILATFFTTVVVTRKIQQTRWLNSVSPWAIPSPASGSLRPSTTIYPLLIAHPGLDPLLSMWRCRPGKRV